MSCLDRTPKYSRNKYDYDPDTGLFELGGLLPEGMMLPRTLTVQASKTAALVQGVPNANRTILIVDDDPSALKLAEIACREAGYRPLCTAMPEDGLLMVDTESPAIIVVDLLMPKMDGLTFIEQVRTRPPDHQPAIVIWTVKDLEAGVSQLPAVAAVVSKRTGSLESLVATLRQLLPDADSAASMVTVPNTDSPT